MKIHFNFPYFDAQLLRTMSYIYTGGADLNECLFTAKKIEDGDFDSWYKEWMQLADDAYQSGMKSISDHCENSARDAFLRAANYYRTATFFHYRRPLEQKLVKAYDSHVNSFAKAVELFKTPVESIKIPYEGTTLSGYFYKPFDDAYARPTIIANTGYDGTHQEMYHFVVVPALLREYNIIAFDGPGQGGSLIKQKLPMRHDWEKVITPAVDYLKTRRDVIPNQIALIGASWGGYLCPRAAAYEHRIAALVANPGQYEALQRLQSVAPNINELVAENRDDAIDAIAKKLMDDANMAFTFQAKMFVHGLDNPVDLIKDWANYNLIESAPKIKCPTFVLDSSEEKFSKGQAKQLYHALTCATKDYELLEGPAGEHCQAGAITAFQQNAFDWLKQSLPIASRERQTVKG